MTSLRHTSQQAALECWVNVSCNCLTLPHARPLLCNAVCKHNTIQRAVVLRSTSKHLAWPDSPPTDRVELQVLNNACFCHVMVPPIRTCRASMQLHVCCWLVPHRSTAHCQMQLVQVLNTCMPMICKGSTACMHMHVLYTRSRPTRTSPICVPQAHPDR